MSSQHLLHYPVKVKIDEQNKYFISSIDYPCCYASYQNLQQALDSVRVKLEDRTWIDSSDNKVISPSKIINIEKESGYFYTEVSVIKRYNAIPSILYYYLPVSEILMKMLTNPYIWFSDPKFFNDPFELPDVFEKSWKPAEEWKDFEYAYKTLSNKLDILKGFKSAQDAFIALKFKKQDILEKVLSLKINSLEKTVNNSRLACFSRYFDNILMWSHYSNKHTGVVIGYNYQSVQDCGGKIAGSDVDYRIHPNKLRTGEYAGEIHEILESEYSTRKLFTKHPSWAYEQEYRLLTTESNGGRFSIPKKCICELYLGCNIDEDIKNALLNIVNDLDIDIYDMVKTSNTDLIRQKVVKQKTR